MQGSQFTGYSVTFATGVSATKPNKDLKVTGKSVAVSSTAIYGTDQNNYSSATSLRVRNQDNAGQPFVEMIQSMDVYGAIASVKGNLEIYILNGDVHWLLLVRLEGGTKLPFLSFEVTTSNMTNIIPTMRLISEKPNNIWRDLVSESVTKLLVGTRTTTLFDLCSIADEVVVSMKTYNVFISNCQHFCNNLLKKLGLRTFLTTIGPNTTRSQNNRFDYLSNVMKQIHKVVANSEDTQSGDNPTISSISAAASQKVD